MLVNNVVYYFWVFMVYVVIFFNYINQFNCYCVWVFIFDFFFGKNVVEMGWFVMSGVYFIVFISFYFGQIDIIYYWWKYSYKIRVKNNIVIFNFFE